MKHMKKAICFIMIILIAIGVCGCMNHNEYSDKILKGLSDKYNKEFEIVKLSYEVDGENGNYYRAVCKEQDTENTFVAYYYLKGSQYLLSEDVGDELKVSKDEPLLIDTYPNLLLNLKVAEQLSKDNGVLFVVADIGAFEHTFTISDIEMGINHCLSNESFDVQSKVYLFASNSIENKEQFEKDITQTILSMNAYKQSIDIAYIADADVEAVKREYSDDIYMIEDRLTEDEKITRYSWYFAERGKGITEKKDVKGV